MSQDSKNTPTRAQNTSGNTEISTSKTRQTPRYTSAQLKAWGLEAAIAIVTPLVETLKPATKENLATFAYKEDIFHSRFLPAQKKYSLAMEKLAAFQQEQQTQMRSQAQNTEKKQLLALLNLKANQITVKQYKELFSYFWQQAQELLQAYWQSIEVGPPAPVIEQTVRVTPAQFTRIGHQAIQERLKELRLATHSMQIAIPKMRNFLHLRLNQAKVPADFKQARMDDIDSHYRQRITYNVRLMLALQAFAPIIANGGNQGCPQAIIQKVEMHLQLLHYKQYALEQQQTRAQQVEKFLSQQLSQVQAQILQLKPQYTAYAQVGDLLTQALSLQDKLEQQERIGNTQASQDPHYLKVQQALQSHLQQAIQRAQETKDINPQAQEQLLTLQQQLATFIYQLQLVAKAQAQLAVALQHVQTQLSDPKIEDLFELPVLQPLIGLVTNPQVPLEEKYYAMSQELANASFPELEGLADGIVDPFVHFDDPEYFERLNMTPEMRQLLIDDLKLRSVDKLSQPQLSPEALSSKISSHAQATLDHAPRLVPYALSNDYLEQYHQTLLRQEQKAQAEAQALANIRRSSGPLRLEDIPSNRPEQQSYADYMPIFNEHIVKKGDGYNTFKVDNNEVKDRLAYFENQWRYDLAYDYLTTIIRKQQLSHGGSARVSVGLDQLPLMKKEYSYQQQELFHRFGLLYNAKAQANSSFYYYQIIPQLASKLGIAYPTPKLDKVTWYQTDIWTALNALDKRNHQHQFSTIETKTSEGLQHWLGKDFTYQQKVIDSYYQAPLDKYLIDWEFCGQYAQHIILGELDPEINKNLPVAVMTIDPRLHSKARWVNLFKLRTVLAYEQSVQNAQAMQNSQTAQNTQAQALTKDQAKSQDQNEPQDLSQAQSQVQDSNQDKAQEQTLDNSQAQEQTSTSIPDYVALSGGELRYTGYLNYLHLYEQLGQALHQEVPQITSGQQFSKTPLPVYIDQQSGFLPFNENFIYIWHKNNLNKLPIHDLQHINFAADATDERFRLDTREDDDLARRLQKQKQRAYLTQKRSRKAVDSAFAATQKETMRIVLTDIAQQEQDALHLAMHEQLDTKSLTLPGLNAHQTKKQRDKLEARQMRQRFIEALSKNPDSAEENQEQALSKAPITPGKMAQALQEQMHAQNQLVHERNLSYAQSQGLASQGDTQGATGNFVNSVANSVANSFTSSSVATNSVVTNNASNSATSGSLNSLASSRFTPLAQVNPASQMQVTQAAQVAQGAQSTQAVQVTQATQSTQAAQGLQTVQSTLTSQPSPEKANNPLVQYMQISEQSYGDYFELAKELYYMQQTKLAAYKHKEPRQRKPQTFTADFPLTSQPKHQAAILTTEDEVAKGWSQALAQAKAGQQEVKSSNNYLGREHKVNPQLQRTAQDKQSLVALQQDLGQVHLSTGNEDNPSLLSTAVTNILVKAVSKTGDLQAANQLEVIPDADYLEHYYRKYFSNYHKENRYSFLHHEPEHFAWNNPVDTLLKRAKYNPQAQAHIKQRAQAYYDAANNYITKVQSLVYLDEMQANEHQLEGYGTYASLYYNGLVLLPDLMLPLEEYARLQDYEQAHTLPLPTHYSRYRKEHAQRLAQLCLTLNPVAAQKFSQAYSRANAFNLSVVSAAATNELFNTLDITHVQKFAASKDYRQQVMYAALGQEITRTPLHILSPEMRSQAHNVWHELATKQQASPAESYKLVVTAERFGIKQQAPELTELKLVLPVVQNCRWGLLGNADSAPQLKPEQNQQMQRALQAQEQVGQVAIQEFFSTPNKLTALFSRAATGKFTVDMDMMLDPMATPVAPLNTEQEVLTQLNPAVNAKVISQAQQEFLLYSGISPNLNYQATLTFTTELDKQFYTQLTQNLATAYGAYRNRQQIYAFPALLKRTFRRNSYGVIPYMATYFPNSRYQGSSRHAGYHILGVSATNPLTGELWHGNSQPNFYLPSIPEDIAHSIRQGVSFNRFQESKNQCAEGMTFYQQYIKQEYGLDFGRYTEPQNVFMTPEQYLAYYYAWQKEVHNFHAEIIAVLNQVYYHDDNSLHKVRNELHYYAGFNCEFSSQALQELAYLSVPEFCQIMHVDKIEENVYQALAQKRDLYIRDTNIETMEKIDLDKLHPTYERVILHCDMNNCFASIAARENPQLQGKAIAVAGDSEQRKGVILARSYAAKEYGITTGEPTVVALKKCPNLILVPPNFDDYRRYSNMASEIYAQYTPHVELYSIDEAWLDVTEVVAQYESPEALANQIREHIKRELGITISVGVSFNKVLAKLGSDMKKPDAVTCIPPHRWQEIVWPRAVSELIGVGRKTLIKLDRLGIGTIGALANTPRQKMYDALGHHGLNLWLDANGLDCVSVKDGKNRDRIKSVGRGTTLSTDAHDPAEIKRFILELAVEVSEKLHRENCLAYGVQISIRDTSFKDHSWQAQMELPTLIAKDLAAKATELFNANYHWSLPVRALTVRAINIIPYNTEFQANMFTDVVGHKKRLRQQRIIHKLNAGLTKGDKARIHQASDLLNEKLGDRSSILTSFKGDE
ncbi:DNA polymerase IV [Psittacicella hinzii]|uniref:DNA polymerase IV n=1 Tax=Psittacicella hinzii TaxID=2028575 RepID=A0A3A1YPZ7_9GAMM|nr:DNA polymerase IV [Psittacicella hinzii]RIY39695.1 DNA polymerase IV [Psittacicella hinzii]